MHKTTVIGFAIIFLAVALPARAQLDDPTDPDAQAPKTQYRPVLHDYHFTPLPALGNWRELNERAEKIGGPLGQLRDPDQPYRKRRRR
jgi:hypothetical protein